MADFAALPVYSGVGAYHVNRFRVAFEKPPFMSAAYLAHHFATKFPLYLNSKFATVEWGSRNFEGKPTMKFHGFKWLLGKDVAAPHHDWVVRQWYDPTIGFTAQTLKRQFVDAVDDTTAYYLERTVGWPSKAAADSAVDINRTHFLAGRRSWRISEGRVFGVSGDVFVIETVAFERFSCSAYNNADTFMGLEKSIPDIWIANLNSFVRSFRFKRVEMARDQMPNPQTMWRTKDGVDFIRMMEDKPESLMRYPAFTELKTLYSSLFP